MQNTCLVVVDLLHGDQSSTDVTAEHLLTVADDTQTPVLPDVAQLVAAHAHNTRRH